MKEKIFNSEVVASLRMAGAWAYKIPDSPVSWTMKQTRFTGAKPFDIAACIYGKFVAIESKQIKKFQKFGVQNLRDSQIENLNAVVKAGGIGVVFLNIRIKPDRGRGIIRRNRLLWFWWSKGVNTWSFDRYQLEDVAYVEGKKKIFDLLGFVNFVREVNSK